MGGGEVGGGDVGLVDGDVDGLVDGDVDGLEDGDVDGLEDGDIDGLACVHDAVWMNPSEPAVPITAAVPFGETGPAVADWLSPGPCAGGTNGVTDDS